MVTSNLQSFEHMTDKTKVAILFCEANGVYSKRKDCYLWPLSRDARKYLSFGGKLPVVAHPPCARWCKLAKLAFSINRNCVPRKDGGCFRSALESVEAVGGVLEHPAYTLAWKHFNLDRPYPWLWRKSKNGWVTQVSQCAYGHLAQKRTWLYYVGNKKPPDIDWTEPPAEKIIGGVRNLSSKQRNATPPDFAELLISLAKYSRLIIGN